jgi:hypothetical protein
MISPNASTPPLCSKDNMLRPSPWKAATPILIYYPISVEHRRRTNIPRVIAPSLMSMTPHDNPPPCGYTCSLHTSTRPSFRQFPPNKIPPIVLPPQDFLRRPFERPTTTLSHLIKSSPKLVWKPTACNLNFTRTRYNDCITACSI